jgi:hypothetical protein
MYNVFVLHPVVAISCIIMSCMSSAGSKLMFWHFRNKFMDYSFFLYVWSTWNKTQLSMIHFWFVTANVDAPFMFLK